MALPLVATCLLAATTLLVPPHERGLSSAALRLEPTAVVVVATFNRAELAETVDSTDSSAMLALFRAGYRVSVDGVTLPLVSCGAKDAPPIDTEVALRFALPGGATLAAGFTLEVPLLERFDRVHRHHVAIADPSSVSAGRPLALLDRATHSVFVKADATAAPRFAGFLVLGIEHVLTGYDHVLFLLALLLVGMSLSTTLLVITAFTVAHSITLGLAALELVTPPSNVVEPLIAATILFVGLENLLVHEPRRRWLVAGSLGLVHGFGFAAVLRELGIGSGTEAVVPLLAFNLGVEVGQAAIALVAVPTLRLACRNVRARRRVLVVGSVITCTLGGWWLLERTVLA